MAAALISFCFIHAINFDQLLILNIFYCAEFIFVVVVACFVSIVFSVRVCMYVCVDIRLS